MDQKLNTDEKMRIQKKFQANRKVIETILKQFTYKQQLSTLENAKVLISCIENVLSIDSLSDFVRHLSHQEHIPIEVSFKNLKLENLQAMFDDWVDAKEQSSFDLQRVYTVNNKNQLLKKILIHQKAQIDEYFSIISSKKKVKGCDIFPLITDLFSNYFLYEFQSDIETFFQKTKAFQKFEKIVENYIKNERRIIVIDKTTKQDQNYIRRYEFEKLMQFWENSNPQLELRQEKRNSKKEIATMTNPCNMNDVEIQTDFNPKVVSEENQNCLDVVNKTLNELNKIVAKENNPATLQSIERMYSCLRNQKIVLAYLQSNEAPNLKNSMSFSNAKKVSSPYNKVKEIPQRNLSPNLLTKRNNLLTPPKRQQSPEFQLTKLTKNIYKHLGRRKVFNLNNLQLFFYEIGLVQIYQNHIILNLLEQNLIQDQESITFEEFDIIIHELMKESPNLNSKVLTEYVNSYIQLPSKSLNLLNSKIQTKTQFKRIRTPPKKENPRRVLSKTTYQLDSDDSYL